MERKGISPLIAAVLLIAFTMAVATIFSQFVTGDLIKKLTGDTQSKAEDISNCNSLSVSFRGNPNLSTAVVEQSSGNSVIGNVTLTWQFNDDTVEQNETYLGSDTALSDGTNNNDVDTVWNSFHNKKSGFTKITVEAEDCPGASGDEYKP